MAGEPEALVKSFAATPSFTIRARARQSGGAFEAFIAKRTHGSCAGNEQANRPPLLQAGP
jgi:hypothetical protein